jgi:hypothetical protein
MLFGVDKLYEAVTSVAFIDNFDSEIVVLIEILRTNIHQYTNGTP